MENNDRFSNPQNPNGARAGWGNASGAPAQARPIAPQAGVGQGQQAFVRPSAPAASSQESLTQEVETLSREREAITNDRARAQGVQERSAADWAELSQQLMAQFGTDDLDAIETELNQRERRNQERVATFRQQLTEARAQVQEALRRQEEARRI